MQAQAAVAIEPGRVAFETVSVPDPGADDVVVRVRHSWISNGTEGSFVRGERIGGDTPRQPSDPMPFPHVPGYQKVGIVESIGENVTHVQPGDVVFATVSKVEEMFYNFAGHVSPAVTHKSQVWKLPPEVAPDAASGLVLTQVGYNVGMRAPIEPGDKVVVIGDGMVGQWAAQTFQHRGAAVCLLGKHDDRLARFVCLDGDTTVNVTQQEPLEAVSAWAGRSVHVVADTVGSIDGMERLHPAMRRDSHLVSAGFYGSNGLLDVQKLRDREMTLHAPAGWTAARIEATLGLLAQGVLSTLPLVTHRFPASRCAEAFGLILARRDSVLGVILDWE